MMYKPVMIAALALTTCAAQQPVPQADSCNLLARIAAVSMYARQTGVDIEEVKNSIEGQGNRALVHPIIIAAYTRPRGVTTADKAHEVERFHAMYLQGC